jgi:hypothetical protein
MLYIAYFDFIRITRLLEAAARTLQLVSAGRNSGLEQAARLIRLLEQQGIHQRIALNGLALVPA